MMVSFNDMNEGSKKKIIILWKKMTETDKAHFINQVAITLSVLGSDNGGRKQVIDIIRYLIEDGAGNLADYGIYMRVGFKTLDKKTLRAIRIVDKYRMKHDLPNMPSKPLV